MSLVDQCASLLLARSIYHISYSCNLSSDGALVQVALAHNNFSVSHGTACRTNSVCVSKVFAKNDPNEGKAAFAFAVPWREESGIRSHGTRITPIATTGLAIY